MRIALQNPLYGMVDAPAQVPPMLCMQHQHAQLDFMMSLKFYNAHCWVRPAHKEQT